MSTEIVAPLITGGVIGFAVGFAVRKLVGLISKIVVVFMGVVFAFMMYLQSLGIIAVDWNKLETVAATTVETVANQTATSGNVILDTLQGWGLAFDFSFVTGVILGVKVASR